MTTTQTNGRDIKRLCHLLDTLIEQLEGSIPEKALGCMLEHEDEVAELIASTGLADEAEIGAKYRPVLKRTLLGWEEFGMEEFVGSAEAHKKHATYVNYQFTESGGMFHIRRFDALTADGLALPKLDPLPPGWKETKPPPGSAAEKLMTLMSSCRRGPRFADPDASYVQTLIMCLKGWRSRAQWKATSEIPDEREVIDDPIANHKLADLCGLAPETVSGQMQKALKAAGKAVKTGGAGINREWTHDELRLACAHLPKAKLKKYLISVGFGN